MLTGSYRYFGTQPCAIQGPGGIYTFDPRVGVVQPITGLPSEVLGATPSTFLHGADFAVRVPHTNFIVANAWGDSTIGQQLPVYVFTLNGLQVVATQRHDVGIVGPGAWGAAGLPQAEVLADGRVLLAVDPTTFQAGEALANTMLAVLDPSKAPGTSGALQPVPVAPLPSGNTNAMAVDMDRGVVWIGVFQQSQSTLYSVPFPSGGAATAVLTMPSALVTGLALEPGGSLLATSYDVSSGAAQLLRIDPSNATSVLFPQLNGMFYAECVCLEPATGDIYVVAGATCERRDVHRITPADPTTGTLAVVAAPLGGGWGVPSGLDINPTPEVYGQPSGSSLDVTWQVAPNAAGLPRIGNSGFALGLTAPTPPLFAAAQLGLTNSTQPIVLGVQLLVDPLVNLVLAPGSTMQVPLAIPYASNLIGTEVLAQVLFFDSSVMLGATAGVQVTVLP